MIDCLLNHPIQLQFKPLHSELNSFPYLNTSTTYLVYVDNSIH